MKNLLTFLSVLSIGVVSVFAQRSGNPSRVPGPVIVQPLGISSNAVYEMIINYSVGATGGISRAVATNVVTDNAVLKLDSFGTNETFLGNTRIGAGAIATNLFGYSPDFIGYSGNNSFFYLNTTNDGGTGNYWTNAALIVQRNESFATISTRPWTLALVNTNELVGGTDAQNEVELAFSTGFPVTGNPHRAYMGWYHPHGTAHAGKALQWVLGVNSNKVTILNDSQAAVHRLWLEPGNFGSQPGMTYINSASNGAVRFNLGTTGSDSTALLGTGGVEFGSGGSGGLQTVVAKINSSGVLGVAGGIYATNLTASRPIFTDANKGFVSTTIDLIPGSNITITTNAANRAWTIASTGGASPTYANAQAIIGNTANTDAFIYYSDGEPALQVDGGSVGEFIFKNLAGTVLAQIGASVTFDNIPSGGMFRVQVNSADSSLMINNGGFVYTIGSEGFNYNGTDGFAVADPDWVDGDLLYNNNGVIKTVPGGATFSISTLVATNIYFTTNIINTGVIPCGKLTYTNLTANITLAGFSGVDLNYNCWAKLYVTNESGPGTPRSVTMPAQVRTSTNSFVFDTGTAVVWVTNDVNISFDIAAWATNAAAIRWSP